MNIRPVGAELIHVDGRTDMLCTASCKHSLVLLRMGEIIARNRLS